MLRRQLGDAVRRIRSGGRVLPQREIRRLAVDRGGRRVHQAADPSRLARRLQQSLGRADVAVEIEVEILSPARTDPGLPGLMEDIVRLPDQRSQLHPEQVCFHEAKLGGREERGEIRLLHGPGVVIGEHVHPDDAMPRSEQTLAEVGADEPRRARDQRCNARHLSPEPRCSARCGSVIRSRVPSVVRCLGKTADLMSGCAPNPRPPPHFRCFPTSLAIAHPTSRAPRSSPPAPPVRACSGAYP